MKKYLAFIALLCFYATGQAQTPLWAFKVGSATADGAIDCEVAPNGTVYLAGNFTGTIDLDPGPATYNVTSVGGDDIFISCYTPSGTFVWGISMGGPNKDNINKMAVDAMNNIVISGSFQGGMDFDPGPGSAVIPYAGGIGATGDGYIAKYSATGGYMWAKDLGGASPFDYTEGLAIDEVNNIYIGGTFNTFMMASPTLSFTSAIAGPGYLIKYDPSGNIIWGHNLGEAAVASNTLMRGITVRNGFIYTCGYFQGNANFCPWGTPTYLTVSATGGFVDAFVAKYDTAGNIVFAKQIAGFGAPGSTDELSGIALDAAGAIYVGGWGSSSSYVFDMSSPATSTLAAPGGGGNKDIMLAKFSNGGAFQWARLFGSGGDDWSRWAIEVAGSEVFMCGKFENTVDFDPSSSVANLVSAGGEDAFLAKYDLNGNYKCAFSIGSSITGESGNGLSHDAAGNIYLSGAFGGAGTDFDPNSAVYPLTSAGSTDGFLAKYQYTVPDVYAGTLLGDSTICAGDSAYLGIHITTGPSGPYDLVIVGPTGTFTVTGVTSDVFFSIGLPSAGTTSAYYVSSATYTGPGTLCDIPGATITDTATITVLLSSAVIAPPSVFCDSVIFTAAPGGGAYTWNFGDGTSGTGTPVTHTYSAAGTYTVLLTTNNGICTASDIATVVVTASSPIVGATQVCAGATSLFTNALAGGTWACTPASVATISASGVLTAVADGVATITYTTSCGQVTKAVTINSITSLIEGIPAICAGKTGILTAAPGGGIWKSNTVTIATVSGSGMVTGISPGMATISYIMGACVDTSTVEVYPGADPIKVSAANPTCNEINGTITFTGLAPGETYIMRWQDPNEDSTIITADGAGDVVLSPLGPGIYQAITVTNSYGCSSAGAGPLQLVNIAPAPPVIKHNDPCVGQTLFLEGYAAPAGGTYKWEFPDGPTNTQQDITRRNVTIAMSGAYSLSYTVNNCTVTTTDNITIYTPPTLINMTPDQTIAWGESVQLFVEGAFVYRWAPNDGSIDNPNINNPVVSPEATTRYYVYGANEAGCVDTATVEIKVNDDADEFIPSAFTPNGDGLNDIFRIRRLQRSQKLIEFSIYNRFGERVYHNEYSPDAGWDGMYKGVPCDLGTYYYQVILGLRDGTKRVHKGDVTLIR